MATRQEVYDALDSERDYQERKWNPTGAGHRHSVAEWLVYIQDYVNEAMHVSARTPDPEAIEFTLNSMRKIAAMGVACMEQNGAPQRETQEAQQPGHEKGCKGLCRGCCP